MSKHCPQGKSAKTVPFLAGVSNLGHTEGKTGSVHHGLILQGGHNITLKEKRHHHECATVKINARDQSVQTQNIFDLILAGNTAGIPSLISSGTLTLFGGNNITLSQAGNAVTISAGQAAISAFTAGMSNIGNISGTTGVVSDRLVFAGGNNVTLSQSINGQSGTITISAANQSIQPGIQSIYAGTTNITTGEAIFLDSNSISFGADGQNITAAYDLMSHDSVYHTGIIGAESQISFDPISGHDHDGIDSRLITTSQITPQYLEVSESPGVGETGKQFTSIAAAIAAAVAGGVASSKPYVIKVYPGTYTEPKLIMQPYIAIIGSGMFNTIITASDVTDHFIIGANNSYVRNCAIVGPTNDYMAAFYYAGTGSDPFTIQDVLVRKGYYGIWANSTTTANVHLINVANWYSSPTAMHTFARATDHGVIVAMSSGFMCGEPGKITRGFSCESADAEIYMDLCYFRNTPTIPVPNDAVFVDNGGHVKLVACTFSIGTNAIHVGANGTGGYVIAVGCNIRNEPASGYVFTTDILMDNFGTMQYTGSCTKSKINISVNATFSASFTDSTTGEEGDVVVGELWLGASVTNSIPLRDYGLTAYSTGWRSLGQVTRSGAPPSFNISVAAGSGYINTGIGVTRISWGPAATIKTCAADTSQWVYVDSAGTVTVSIIEPNYPDVILLAAIRTNNNHVVFLTNHDISLHQTVPTTYNYLEKIFGPVSFEGCDVTQTVGIGNELKVDFAVGKYFCGLQELQPATTSPVTFTYWYRKVGSSGWNTSTPGGGGSDFDTTQYDDNSGILAPLPGGKYKKDLLIVVKNGVGTEFHVIYGQQYYDILTQAEVTHVFEIPDLIKEHGLQVAGIVVLSGAGVIASIIDERNKFVSEHNNLRELQGGNSVLNQYYHIDYADYTARNQKIVVTLAGNSTSAGAGYALISTGTMYLAGGNSITLSQNGNNVTIVGAQFNNANNVSFGVNVGTITATATFAQSAEPRVISLNNTSGSLTLLGSRNITVANNADTISIYGPASIVSGISLDTNGNTAGVMADITSGTMYLAGGNNITLSQNANSVTISGIQFSNDNNVSFGTAAGKVTATATFAQSAEPRVISLNNTSGSLTLLGSRNITVANNADTISIYGPASIVSGISLNTDGNTAGVMADITSGTMYLAGGNNITLSQNANSVTISGIQFSNDNNVSFGTAAGKVTATATFALPVQTLGLTNTTAGGGTGGTGGGASGNAIKYVFVAGSNITLSQSINAGGSSGTLSIYAADPTNAGIAKIGYANNVGSNESTFGSGSVIFSGLTNITVNTSANGASQYIQISANDPAAAQGVSAIAGSNTTYTSGLLIFSNVSNITVCTSVNGASQYIRLSVADAGGNALRALSGSNASIADSTITFGNSNGLLFYITEGSMVGSYTVPTQSAEPRVISLNNTSGSLTLLGSRNITVANNADTISIYGPASIVSGISLDTNGNTAGVMADITSGTMYLAGGNNITLSQNANSVTISGIQFSNDNNVSFGTAAGKVTATATFAQSAEPRVISLNNTSGSLTLLGSRNITVANNADTISVYGPANILNSFSIGGNIGFTNSSSITGGGFVIAGGSNITLSQSNNTLSIHGAPHMVSAVILNTDGNTAGVMTSISSGTLNLAGGNSITLSQNANSVTIIGPQFSNSNNVSFGVNAGTITATATFTQSTAPSGLYANTILTTFTSGNVGFSGSNNITVTTATAGQVIVISGPNTHAQQTGISSIGATDVTYTAGGVTLYGSGIVSLSSTLGQGIVISAPGVISLNGYSSTVTISAGNNISINNAASTINIINLLSSAVTASSITSVNVIGANVSRFALEGHQHAGVRAVGISSGGNTSGNTAVLPGQLVLIGGNNITLSQATSNNNDMTITISAGTQVTVPTLSYWGNADQTIDIMATSDGRFWLFPLNPTHDIFPGNMTASTALLNFSNSGGGAVATKAFGYSWKIGIYTINGVSLSLLNSVVTSFGTSQDNTAASSMFQGERFLTIHSSVWSAQPTFSQTKYFVGIIGNSTGENSPSFSIQGFRILESATVRSGTIGVGLTSGNTSMGVMPWIGVSGATRNLTLGLPTNIQLSQLVKTGALYGFIPHIQFNNISSNF